MQEFRHYSVRAVMLILLGSLCLILGGMSLHSSWSLSRIFSGNEIDRQLVKQMTVLNQGNEQYFRFVSHLARAMEIKNTGAEPDYTLVKEAIVKMGAYLDEMKVISSGLMDKQLSEQVINSWQVLLDQGVIPQLAFAIENDILAYNQHSHNVTPALSRSFGATVTQFNQAAEKMINQTRNVVDGLVEMAQITIITASLLGLCILVLTDRYLVNMLKKPLDRFRQYFSHIAKGDFSQEIIPFGRNCVGQLFPLLDEMQHNLRKAVTTIRVGSENIYRDTAEMSNGNYDLFIRTEEQVAALKEIVASMVQMIPVVKLNIENVYQASQLMKVASSTVKQSDSMAELVITAMKENINNSKKVSDIVSIINNISLHMDTLALNAAIEAARIGVHGRGFMVIAEEIRTLARYSADVAKEIEHLIADSSSNVEKGAQLANEMSCAMENVLQSINEATMIMNEVAVASEEQGQGIFQVSMAINQMNKVCQQNASLVEQVATTAGALEQQTEELQLSVQKFHLTIHSKQKDADLVV